MTKGQLKKSNDEYSCLLRDSIVFSFWKRSLDLVEQLFLEQNIVFVRVDGGLSQSQREKALAEFQDSSSIRVLLITLGTGAVG